MKIVEIGNYMVFTNTISQWFDNGIGPVLRDNANPRIFAGTYYPLKEQVLVRRNLTEVD